MRKFREISFSYSFFSNTMGLHFSSLILSLYFFEISKELQICFVLSFIILKHTGICCGFWFCESSACLTLMNLHSVIDQMLEILSEWVEFCDQRKQANSDGSFYVFLSLQIDQINFIHQILKTVEMIFFFCLLHLSQAKLIQKNEDAELYVQDCFDELPVYLFHFHS